VKVNGIDGVYDGEGATLYDGEGATLYDGEGATLYDGEGATYDGEGATLNDVAGGVLNLNDVAGGVLNLNDDSIILHSAHCVYSTNRVCFQSVNLFLSFFSHFVNCHGILEHQIHQRKYISENHYILI